MEFLEKEALGKSSTVCQFDELEPQVTSADPNERKLARRIRIERRLEVLQKSKQSVIEKNATDEGDPIYSQLQKTTEILEKFMLEGEEYITNVRVANDSREVNRYQNESVKREKILKKLSDEAAKAQTMFNDISKKWGVIQKYNDPLRIHEDIMRQKENCDLLIRQKDGIIAMLIAELKAADNNFTKDQKKQIEDIDILTRRVEKQITFMRQAYRQELEAIETVILVERKILIEAADKKWQELYKKRQDQEILNSEIKFEQLDDYYQRMDKLRIDFQERFREIKIKLENDIDALQRELERIKALTLLNSEKLEYNYQILKKREDENIIIKSQQKRRMNKLQDIIKGLRDEINEYEVASANTIKKISDNIKRLHKNILEVETKADHFARVNDEKFHMVWEMNKKSVQSILRQILDTDKILYEQQLGMEWDPPQDFTVDKKSLPSYKTALNVVDSKFVYELAEDSAEKIKKTVSVSSKAQDISREVDGSREEEAQAQRGVIRHILMRISDKSGFLTERGLNNLLKGYEEEQKHLALGIEDQSYINVLVNHFLPYTFCPVCQSSTLSGTTKTESKIYSHSSQLSSMFSKFGDSETLQIPELDDVLEAIRPTDDVIENILSELIVPDETIDDDLFDRSEDAEDICGAAIGDQYVSSGRKTRDRKRVSLAKISEYASCQFNHPLIISSVYVLRALREFVTSYYVAKTGAPTIGEQLQKKRLTISRCLSEQDIKSYWEKFKMNFTDDRVRTWDALLEGLKKYHEILKDRKAVCDDVVKLRKENAELKRLLANYLGRGDYMEPPCANEKRSGSKK
ncbi:dynein regulatory complex protein 1 isoform X2 [Cylas formicarius]|uniref:dynein regulatory complex protein 1 isoform X2 n=1 Tax=Cylas formicarius TaxID=197179 RepID=UPI00295847C3|nr:dynein regulatory complex protein 1 isoform X2 [Cylas formicarius]